MTVAAADSAQIPDLMPAKKGCIGYVTCLGLATTTSQRNACADNATAMALSLNTDLTNCLTTACVATGDGGSALCTGTSDSSSRCQNCLMAAALTGGACASAAAACRADTP